MGTLQFVSLLLLVPACLAKTLPDSDNDTELIKLKIQIHKLQDQLGNITSLLQNGNLQAGPSVHFSARISSIKTLNMNSIVVFDEVIDDYGNNYNPGDGVFMAPITGFYQFSWALHTASKKYIYTELRVNNIVVDYNYVYSDASGVTSSSKTVICKVNKGEHVWIQTSTVNTEHYFYMIYAFKNSFMGLLVHTTDS